MPSAARPLSRLPLLAQADRLGAIDAILKREFEGRRAEGTPREDVLGLLARAKRDDGTPLLSVSELRDQVLSLLIGGQDTIATTLCWALVHLARHPAVCAAIRSEYAMVFPNGLDPQRIDELRYLAAALQESMRLTPTVVGMARRLLRDTVIDGYTIPAGTPIFTASYLAHRSEQLWERPDAFDPTRFLHKKAPMHTFFPYGAGVWRCVGASFADFEMRIVLACIVSQFDLELASGGDLEGRMSGVTVWPADGFRVRMRPRARAPRVSPARDEALAQGSS